MSEKMLKFLMSELTTVRVICTHKASIANGELCGGIAEVPIEKLVFLKACPICGQAFQHAKNSEAIRNLVNSLEWLKDDNYMKFEFMLPAKD